MFLVMRPLNPALGDFAHESHATMRGAWRAAYGTARAIGQTVVVLRVDGPDCNAVLVAYPEHFRAECGEAVCRVS